MNTFIQVTDPKNSSRFNYGFFFNDFDTREEWNKCRKDNKRYGYLIFGV